MIWRRLGSTTVGSSPPPVRALYPDPNGANLKVWTRQRAKTYTNGALTIDSGWTAWSDNTFDWPAAGNASNNGTTVIRMDITIETAGRYMPWQIVMQDRIDPLAGGAPTFVEYTVTMLPGTVTTFSFDAASGTHRFANKHMLLVPAEGV